MLPSLSPLVVLALQAAGMFVVTYLCGIVPLYLTLSKTKLRILEVLGAGLLVGASMTVVLPEGVSALFSSGSDEGGGHDGHGSEGSGANHVHRIMSRVETHRHGRAREIDPESAVGIAVLSGFLVMFLIDQIAAPGAHVHGHPSSTDRDREAGQSSSSRHQYAASHRPEAMRLTRASSLNYPAASNVPGGINGTASPRLAHLQSPSTRSESSPETLPEDHDYMDPASASLLRSQSPNAGGSGAQGSRGRKGSNAASTGRDGSAVGHSRDIRSAIASIAGLMIHASADGIAMGASAGSGNDGLKIIVLFAIMIHKAPAAFGLCALLMGQRLHKAVIRRAIGIFSLATPVGALVSYLFLALVLPSTPGSGSSIAPHHIGGALTFSAGTFMYVAMHAVNELAGAAADYDVDTSAGFGAGSVDPHHNHHPHHHHHAHSHLHDHNRRHASVAEASEPGSHAIASVQPPRQILGRTGRVAVFVLGTMLPKTLQSLVGHGH